MSAAERFGRVAEGFSRRVDAVPAGGWDRPAPCDGWVARDVVAHLVDWVPAVFGRSGLAVAPATPVSTDPARAWHELRTAVQAALDDPAVSAVEFDAGPPGTMTVADAVDRLVVGDVLVHTWDLARACGLDERLDLEMVVGLLTAMEPLDEVLRASGHFGPRVEVPADADPQSRLIAFTGRHP